MTSAARYLTKQSSVGWFQRLSTAWTHSHLSWGLGEDNCRAGQDWSTIWRSEHLKPWQCFFKEIYSHSFFIRSSSSHAMLIWLTHWKDFGSPLKMHLECRKLDLQPNRPHLRIYPGIWLTLSQLQCEMHGKMWKKTREWQMGEIDMYQHEEFLLSISVWFTHIKCNSKCGSKNGSNLNVTLSLCKCVSVSPAIESNKVKCRW